MDPNEIKEEVVAIYEEAINMQNELQTYFKSLNDRISALVIRLAVLHNELGHHEIILKTSLDE